MHLHVAGPFQGFKRGDRGHKLHTVIGGVRLPAFEFTDMRAINEDGAPAARPRIARASAIRIDDNAFKVRIVLMLCVQFTARKPVRT